ncbi:MAG: adenylyl-sulfate kinase [Alphaproteobacteria bacterium]|jgi:bifunctional enzyme CysN/CysC|nr:adenylyl-sulfate kinase [Alphaproteobacteria bacterium]
MNKPPRKFEVFTDAARQAGTRSARRLDIAIVGHVDHGKSTLVGRLLHDTGTLPDGKVEAIRKMCERRGMAFEWAFVMDAFQAERDQAVTIDAAHIWFSTKKRDYVIVDAPGHREFVKNMVSGAASCSAALLVIDAGEGVREQSRRHAYFLHLLGLSRITVAVNKMDAVDFDGARFAAVEADIRDYLAELGITPSHVVPVSARDGDNIAARSERSSWYNGPTVTEALDAIEPPEADAEAPLRLPVQDIFHFDDRRIIAGRIESGAVKIGDELLFSPSNKRARLSRIESWPEANAPESAAAGQSVGLILDEQIFVERGEVISHVVEPPLESNVFRGHVFWLGRKPLATGKQYKLKLGTFEAPVEVQSIDRIIDVDDLATVEAASGGAAIERNGVGEVVLRSRAMLALDEFATNRRTGRFVLVDGYDIAGGGIISMRGYPDQRQLITGKSSNLFAVEDGISNASRWQRNGHRGGVVWFTGLSGSGKTTIALEAERQLFQKGYQVFVLDGDNVRGGLNANLSFSPEDRAENIRRVGEVAALFADAGFVVLTAFISPYRADRERAREAAQRHPGGVFHEVYVKAALEICEERDPKGLYRKARAGDIADFTGISAPYEAPEEQQLVIDTGEQSAEQSAAALVAYIEAYFVADES